MAEKKKVAIIMGSDSDFPTVSGAIKTLAAYGVPFEVHIMSAHRTPEKAAEFAANAKKNGFGVIIAAAGKAAHLAGTARTMRLSLPYRCSPSRTRSLQKSLRTRSSP